MDHLVTTLPHGGTHLILGQGFQVLQDLNHHCLTQLAVLSQEPGVSPVQAVIGVNWVKKRNSMSYGIGRWLDSRDDPLDLGH